jgi:hypothetical protein
MVDTSQIRRAAAALAGSGVKSVRADSGLEETARWHELVAQIGAEVAAPLTAALERINALTSTGRIDKTGLRALRDEVEAARRAGMIGQQLTRFASGRLRQSHESLQLHDVLNGVLAHRSRETHARGITLKPMLKPAEVLADAALLFSLLNSTLDWALANAQSQIEYTIDVRNWPVHPRLHCRFAHRPIDMVDETGPVSEPPAAVAGLDSLVWRLLEQTAWTMGVTVERRDERHLTMLTLEFPRSAAAIAADAAATEINDGFSPSTNSQPLAGSHVLVVASRRDLRVQIRDALRSMSLIVDFVNTVDEAVGFCREGLPHAIVVESIQCTERFAAFRDEITAEAPDFVFIEIVEEGKAFELSSFSGTNTARVGRDAIASSLSPALVFELSKGI